MKTNDDVNSPAYYYDKYTNVECHELCGWLPFYVGSAVKYIFRAGNKSGIEGGITDVMKAKKNIELFSDCFEDGVEFSCDYYMLEEYCSFDPDSEEDVMLQRLRMFKGVIIKLICVDSSDDLLENIEYINKLCDQLISYLEFMLAGGVDTEASYMGVAKEDMSHMYKAIIDSHIMDIDPESPILE